MTFEELAASGRINYYDKNHELIYCSDLVIDKLVIPSYVKYIDSYAFEYCSIKEIIFEEGVEKIFTNAFYNTHVQSVTIPKSVVYIAQGNFENCHDLKRVFINKNENINFPEKEELKNKGILIGTIEDLIDSGKTLKEINEIIQIEERNR